MCYNNDNKGAPIIAQRWKVVMKKFVVSGKSFVKAFENLYVPHSWEHVLFYNVKDSTMSFYYISLKYGACEIVMNDSIDCFNELAKNYEFVVEACTVDGTLCIIVR